MPEETTQQVLKPMSEADAIAVFDRRFFETVCRRSADKDMRISQLETELELRKEMFANLTEERDRLAAEKAELLNCSEK